MIAKILNKIARITNKWLMLIIALIITVLLFSGVNQDITEGFWIIFIILSTIFTLNGILLLQSFKNDVNKYMKEGKNVKGIQGFDELSDALRGSRNQSFLITLSSILSFIIFIISKNNVLKDFINLSELGPTLAVSMAFIALGIMFLVDYPEDPSLTPGGLIGYFEPDAFPLILDNILSDVFMTYIDPATFMKIDEWSAEILSLLKPEFENDETEITRLERAREKILLLAYLEQSNPSAFSSEIIHRELSELFGEENVETFLKGGSIGLTWKEIKSIIKRIEKNAPEPFKLVDRLIVNLTDNYEYFKNGDLYFTVAAKINQGSVKESTGIIIFLLNKTDKIDRSFTVWYETDKETLHPAKQTVEIELDPMTDPFPDKKPQLVGEGDDVISLLSTLLQVGDAVWFRIQPRGFGYRVVSLFIQEKGKHKTLGQSYEIKFTKSLSWYVKAYAPKLSALGSVALPFLKTLFNL